MTIKPLFCSSNVGVLWPQEPKIPCWDSLIGKFFQFPGLLSAFKWSLLCPHSLFYDPSKCLRSSTCLLSVQDIQPQVPSITLTGLPLLTVLVTTLYHLISGWSSKVLSLPNKVITALFWTLRNSSNATKTTLVFRASTSCSELIFHPDLLGTQA